MGSLRIGFDVAPLHRPFPRGVARACGELVRALERRGRIEVVRLAPGPDARLARWRQAALPRAARRGGLAGIHSFTSAFPLTGPGARVQTVHELPWRHGVRENAGPRHRFWAAVGPLRASAVLCPTEHVARDLRRRLLPGAARVRVVPWGVGPPFEPEPPPGTVDEVVLDRYALGEGAFALAPGAVRAKKGLDRVLRGLAELRRGGGRVPDLVVSGPETADLRRDLGLASRLGLARYVQTIGEIEEEHLPALYRLAACVPVLSRSEGFGLPVLEALACGTPPVVPRGSAQAEVAGGAGIEVDANDPRSVADGIAGACAERERMRARLPERARELSWDACAGRVEELWEELAAR